MAGDERFRGPAGKDGEPGKDGAQGPQGDPGKDAVLDHEQLAAELLKRFPTFVIQLADKNGQAVEEIPFQLDIKTNSMIAKLPPIPVTTYDENDNRIGTDTYPLGWTLRIKPLPIKSEK